MNLHGAMLVREPDDLDGFTDPSYEALAVGGGKAATGAGVAPAAGPPGNEEGGRVPDDAADFELFQKVMNEAAQDPAQRPMELTQEDQELQALIDQSGLGDQELEIPEAVVPKRATQKPAKKPAAEAPADDIDEIFGADERESTVERRKEALLALKRDGYSKEALRRMDDETILEVGLARAEAQRKLDAKLNERRNQGRGQREIEPSDEFETEAEETDQDEGSDPGQAVAPGQTGSPTVDVGAAADRVSRRLGKVFSDAFGEEIGGPVSKALKEALVEFAKPLQAENAQLKQGLQVVAGDVEKRIVREARAELMEDFPELGDKEVMRDVLQLYFRFGKSKAFSGPEGAREAFEYAVRAKLGQTAGARRGDINTTKAKARPTTSRRLLRSGSDAGTAAKKGTGSADQREFSRFLEAIQKSSDAGWQA